jgi:predicted ATP-grasp superfamily ATP-dependent carboligase
MVKQMNPSQEKYITRSNDPIAFILGIYPTSNLGAVRNLGRHGVPTVVLDIKKNQAAFYSKYTKGFVCPHPKYDEDAYIDFLIYLGAHLPEKGVLIPTGDTETLALLRHRSQLESYYHFTMDAYEKVNLFINKKLFYKYLEKHNIPHPKTYFPQDESDVKAASVELSYPCIVKPVYPTYFRFDFNTKLFIASSPQQLLSLCTKAHEKKHEVMLQEIIPGKADTMFGFNAYYDHHGAPHGMFEYQRIREWPLGFGNGCYIRHVEEPMLEDMTTSLIRKIDFYGIVDAEFKRDSRDGLFKFIEVNPRVWMQNGFPSRYGCNLPYIAYLDAVKKPLPENPLIVHNHVVKWVYFLEDIQSVQAQMRAGSIRLRAILPAYYLRNEFALFAWDDPLPFFILGSKSISTLFSTLLHSSDSR